MAQKFAILGLGIFGTQLARTLVENGCEVIAVDGEMDNIEGIADDVHLAVQGDFTRLDVLVEAGVAECDIAIVTAGEKLETSVLSIMNLQELGVKKIIAKTRSLAYKEVLERVGATRVIIPELDVARIYGNQMTNPNLHNILRLDEEYNFIEFQPIQKWVGRTIDQLDFRQRYGVNIIAFKASEDARLSIHVNPNHRLEAGNILFGLTDNDRFEQEILHN
ncbi:potassium transporter [Suicoccus acidiformans]|uniref:Potassium transporter n=1 Tax=Suicoccus acidiformans TaxID=2036206 RepID=A0A347WJX5_9LACT|nr:TrkA family potassium uptake protein [Suicoccus acidiformans]AXY25382.1 potassium transporter [Suicoccus acidiformans]